MPDSKELDPKYDLDEFRCLKLITGEDLFVADLFETGELLEEKPSDTVFVMMPMRAIVMNRDENYYSLTIAPWMSLSPGDYFPIKKTSILTYGPIKEEYAKLYMSLLEQMDKRELEDQQQQQLPLPEEQQKIETPNHQDVQILKKFSDFKKKPIRKKKD